MVFPIRIPIELVELIKFVLPELIFIVVTTLAAIGIIIAIICMAANIRKSKKFKDVYISFTKDEWADYKSRYGKAFVEELLKSYDLYPKNNDPRKKLCGTWCNDDDTIRYYITDNNGFFTFMMEHRPLKFHHAMILRTSAESTDQKTVFIADGSENETLTLGYNKGDDTLFIAGRNTILIRIEEYMKRKKSEPQSSVEGEVTISDIESID